MRPSPLCHPPPTPSLAPPRPTPCLPFLTRAPPSSRSAASIAALNGHTETVKVLIEAGADVEAAVVDGVTPLHFGGCAFEGCALASCPPSTLRQPPPTTRLVATSSHLSPPSTSPRSRATGSFRGRGAAPRGDGRAGGAKLGRNAAPRGEIFTDLTGFPGRRYDANLVTFLSTLVKFY